MSDKKHIHYDKILEWANDPIAEWQSRPSVLSTWESCAEPLWNPKYGYRRKPRWFDMEQEWIARGKPPVESNYLHDWKECEPRWFEDVEYRFKKVSRHAALIAEWESKGRPKRQRLDTDSNEWLGINVDDDVFYDSVDYRIKATPHPDADVLRALAEDKDMEVQVLVIGVGYVKLVINELKLRIKPHEKTK